MWQFLQRRDPAVPAEAVAATVQLLHHWGGQRRVQEEEEERGEEMEDCLETITQSLFFKCKTQKQAKCETIPLLEERLKREITID